MNNTTNSSIFLEYNTHTHTHTHPTLYLLPQVLPHGSSPQGHHASRHPGKAPRVFSSHLTQQPSPSAFHLLISLGSVLSVHIHCHDLLWAPVISPLDSPAWSPVNSQLPCLPIYLPHCCRCKPPVFTLRRLIYLIRWYVHIVQSPTSMKEWRIFFCDECRQQATIGWKIFLTLPPVGITDIFKSYWSPIARTLTYYLCSSWLWNYSSH